MAALSTVVCALALTACTGVEGLNGVPMHEIISKALRDGEVCSLAMPDGWANWGESWRDIGILYGLEHTDRDMSSVEELETFASGEGDIGDVGYEYAPIAEKRGLTLKFKSSYWDEIPRWAKDDDGDWIVCYTCTLAFLVDESVTHGQPVATWHDLLEGDYTVAISDVTNASLGQYSVYAAALAMGGSADNIQPGIDFFRRLAEEGRLIYNVQGNSGVLASGAGVNLRWDFIALQCRDEALALAKPIRFTAHIPDVSVTIGYASIINSKARNPHAAALMREYILSDDGQLNLAKGYATPIRAIRLPADIESMRIPSSQYNDQMIQNALDYNSGTAERIVKAWNEQIMPLVTEGGE